MVKVIKVTMTGMIFSEPFVGVSLNTDWNVMAAIVVMMR
jgi:hypothetical protein